MLDIYNSPVSGIVAIDLEGGTTLYVTADAEYMFAGDLYSLGKVFQMRQTNVETKLEEKFFLRNLWKT